MKFFSFICLFYHLKYLGTISSAHGNVLWITFLTLSWLDAHYVLLHSANIDSISFLHCGAWLFPTFCEFAWCWLFSFSFFNIGYAVARQVLGWNLLAGLDLRVVWLWAFSGFIPRLVRSTSVKSSGWPFITSLIVSSMFVWMWYWSVPVSHMDILTLDAHTGTDYCIKILDWQVWLNTQKTLGEGQPTKKECSVKEPFVW